MRFFNVFIDPKTGSNSEANEEQLTNTPNQILVIQGIQVLAPPPIWIGEYQGELLFYPWKLLSLNQGEYLSIQLNNVIVNHIENTSYNEHIIDFTLNGENKQIKVGPLFEALQSLANL
jgi:hypothetical protein